MHLRFVLFGALIVPLANAVAQYPAGLQGSSNVHVLAHLPLGGWYSAADIEIEQEVARPYAYVSRFGSKGGFYGFDIVSIATPRAPKVLYSWVIENGDLHRGHGSVDARYFKVNGRYYVAEAFQFSPSGPDYDLGAVVVDVTGLPDTTTIQEVGRIRTPDTPGGFHNIFTYKHSSGRVLMFASVVTILGVAHGANIYDMERFVTGAGDDGLVSRIPLPEPRAGPGVRGGYHDAYVAYDPSTRRDLFYGGGPEVTPLGGNYIYDVSNPVEPELLASVVGFAGQHGAHTFVPTPDGRYLFIRSGGDHQPLRVFDLKPAMDGEVKNVNRPVGAWTADWNNKLHNMEVRWPYMFVSGYEDGLHIVNVMDPTTPYTVGYYDTYDGPHRQQVYPFAAGSTSNGAWGVDIRNADGLIVVSDMRSGFWVLKMDGFDGWNGHQWGMPNSSSAQDWDGGPDGAPAPARVSAR